MTQRSGLESEPYSGNLSLVKVLDGCALDRKIRASGWNFLFHGSRSKSDVLWCRWSEEDRARIETDSGEGKAATLQRPRGDGNRCQAFSGRALYRRLGTLSACPAELLLGWRLGTADVPARRRMGQRLSASLIYCTRRWGSRRKIENCRCEIVHLNGSGERDSEVNLRGAIQSRRRRERPSPGPRSSQR